MPFLRNVTRERNVPEERLAEVAEHYLRFGGRSPINEQTRQLIAALETELERSGPRLPVYWGNRNWAPMLSDTVAQMVADGRRHAVAFVTSAYSSYSSCRQYREDIARAQRAAGPRAPFIEKVRQFYNHPGFIEPSTRNVVDALERLPVEDRAGARLVFTAHSIPNSMAASSRYESQLREASRLVVERIGSERQWDLAFQSRSGPPQVPWLGPDVCDHLESLTNKGVGAVVMVPIGFVSDHLEVLYDLDTEAMAKARELGMRATRAATVGTDPRFVRAVRDLIDEHIDLDAQRLALGLDGPVGCLDDGCCLAAGARPALPLPAESTSRSTTIAPVPRPTG